MANNLLKLASFSFGILVVAGLAVVLWIDSSGDGAKGFRQLVEESEKTDKVGDPSRRIGIRAAVSPSATDSEIEYANFVEFPDGAKVSIEWHRMPTPPWRQEPPFVDDYPVLRKEAENGNAGAAFRLWQILSRCQRAYEKEEQLTDALNSMRETHRVQLPGMGEPEYVASSDTRDTLASMMARSFRDCKGLTSDQKQERSRWLEDAAFAQYPVAMMEYSSIVTDHDTGVAIDRARWEKGDAHALQSLAERYWKTYVSGVHPDNKIESFAHLYAYTRIAEIRFERGGGVPDAPLLRSVRQKFREMSDRMRPAEMDLAIERAKSLIADNPACCFAF